MSAPSDELTTAERVDALASLVNEALRLLARSALTVEEGCRIAARAWWLARPVAPEAANRLNATLHRLSKNASPKEVAMPQTERILDVRREPPARRHELIFDTYHALGEGEGFVLVNDHDPKPLRYQFEAEYPAAYSWD